MRRPLIIIALGVWIGIFGYCQGGVQAQTAIINVPTTDVLPPKKLYVEADYIAHPRSYEKGGFHYFGPSIIYGLRKNVEVGFNAYYTISAEPDALEIQPNVKWQFYSDEENGFGAALGGVLIIPLKNRDATNDNAILYLTLSKQFKARYGPRVTSGAYTFVGRMDEGSTRGGVLLGYEQPLNSKLMFVADWYSGRNSFGYSAAGLGLTLPKETYLFGGYSFGNEGRANNALVIFLGRTF